MPTWRNGRRAAFRSQSPHGGVGSTPIVGTIFTLKIAILPHFCSGIFFECYIVPELNAIKGWNALFRGSTAVVPRHWKGMEIHDGY